MTKHTLVFATHNQHKLTEIKEFMPGWVDLKSLDDIGYNKEIPETGTTLEKNALLKAYTIFSKTNLDCFADDTGLEVDALDGAPGVYSARYAGTNASFDDNVNLLLKNLEGKDNRKARFRTLIYLIFNGKKWLFEGFINGTITKDKHGSSGFGYDPVFQPEGYDKTFAEMSLEEKNKISHRGLAMIKMLNYFEAQEEGTSLAGQGEFA